MEEVSDFADLSLQGAQQAATERPTGEYPSIDEVINLPIIITGYVANVETDNGTRTLVKFKWQLGSDETAFFTSSKKLTATLEDANIRFPFSAMVKVVLYGNMAGFVFRSAKSPVTQEDINNKNYYLTQKRGYMKNRNR